MALGDDAEIWIFRKNISYFISRLIKDKRRNILGITEIEKKREILTYIRTTYQIYFGHGNKQSNILKAIKERNVKDDKKQNMDAKVYA